MLAFMALAQNTIFYETLVNKINRTFIKEIQSGLIEVIQINPKYYPIISTYSKTNETERRVFWRTKQNLDLIYLMNFCQSKGTFYVHLEDDIITRVSSIKFWNFIIQCSGRGRFSPPEIFYVKTL